MNSFYEQCVLIDTVRLDFMITFACGLFSKNHGMFIYLKARLHDTTSCMILILYLNKNSCKDVTFQTSP
jgi:hypothetical protein